VIKIAEILIGKAFQGYSGLLPNNSKTLDGRSGLPLPPWGYNHLLRFMNSNSTDFPIEV